MTDHPMYTILLVDDNHDNLFTLRTLLESSMEVTVIEADSGSAALDVISRHSGIDLIMLDIQMPGMNGFEVAHLLRSRPKYSSIPIIFLTAVYTTDDFKHEGLKQGAIDYLTKPIDDIILLNRIKAHLRLIENERALNRRLQQLNAQLQQEIEERRRVENELREAKDAALRSKDQALKAERDALAAKQAEQEARLLAEEAQAAAEIANRTKSEFLRNMSHELKTPLNGILGYAQILKNDSQLTEQHRESLDIIRRSGEHLLTLLNDILDLSNIDSEQLQLEPVAFHLPALLDKLVDMARLQAQTKGLAVRYIAPNSLPDVVYGDERRLRQVLLHLLGNAIKFTEQGTVTLRILDLGFEILDLEDAQSNSSNLKSQISNLKFEISDTGIGIAPDQMERVFLPFERLADTGSYTEGAGIGLALSRHLLLLMNSRLQSESRPGQGSTFWFEITFPTMPVENELCNSSQEPVYIAEQAEFIQGTPPPLQILDALLDAASIGDINEILAQIQELEHQTPTCQPFIDNIRSLARAFKIKQIGHVLASYRDAPAYRNDPAASQEQNT